MTDEKDIGEELLKQNGIEPDKLSGNERVRICQLLVRQEVLIRKLKWVAVTSWVGVLLGPLAVMTIIAALPGGDPDGMHYAVAHGCFVMNAMFWTAALVYEYISRHIRTRSLNSLELRASLKDISAQLKRLAEKE